MFGSNALNREAEDSAGALVGFGLGACFGFPDDGGAFYGHFIAKVVEQFLLRFVRSHSGNGFEAVFSFLLCCIEITLTTLNLTLKRGNLVLTRIK